MEIFTVKYEYWGCAQDCEHIWPPRPEPSQRKHSKTSFNPKNKK
jgi:hypothetical protein